MKISELMEKDPLQFEVDDTLEYAAKMLAKRGMSDAPIVEARKLIGIISTSDIASVFIKHNLLSSTKADVTRVHKEPVSKHMHKVKSWLRETDDLFKAIEYLAATPCDSILVTNKADRLVGVLLANTVCEEMAKMLLGRQGEMPSRATDKIAAEEKGQETAVDHIVNFVRKKGVASAPEVAKECGITVKEVEDYATSLERDGILRVEYTMFGEMKLRKPE
jgi:CBS domain-containing protein